MCVLVRKHLPKATIVIGGHIANNADLPRIIDKDWRAVGFMNPPRFMKKTLQPSHLKTNRADIRKYRCFANDGSQASFILSPHHIP